MLLILLVTGIVINGTKTLSIIDSIQVPNKDVVKMVVQLVSNKDKPIGANASVANNILSTNCPKIVETTALMNRRNLELLFDFDLSLIIICIFTKFPNQKAVNEDNAVLTPLLKI